MKAHLLLLFFVFYSFSISAQRIEKSLALSSTQIQQEQWILQHNTNNLLLKWSASALEITLLNTGAIPDQLQMEYIRIPILSVTDHPDKYTLQMGPMELRHSMTPARWGQDNVDFMRTIENSTIVLCGMDHRITLKKGQDVTYNLYSTTLERFHKFLTRFDWQLIALNRDSDTHPALIASFDFDQQVIRGAIDNIPFKIKFSLFYNQGIMSFQHFELLPITKDKAYRQVKKVYTKYFTTAYHYDIAEQTLNFYKGNELVLMFGLIHKY